MSSFLRLASVVFAQRLRGGFLTALAFALSLSLGACASQNHAVLQGSQASNIITPPHIVIGIEKFPVPAGEERIQYNVAQGPHCDPGNSRCINLDLPGFSSDLQDLWSNRLDDRTQQAVTHIVEINDTGSCTYVRYNIYGPNECGRTELQEPVIRAEDSWRLFDEGGLVESVIEERIRDDHITHVIVLVTGWRVQQEGTFSTSAEWIRNINGSFEGGEFRPLYILLTWPAFRTDRYLSFLNKGHDADEVGLTWANVLLNRTLANVRARTNVNVVAIGHSFGARLLSTATFSAGAIGAPNCGGPDLLIGLQAAFSNGRFFDRDRSHDLDRRAYVVEGCRTQAAYTTSRRDGGIVLAPTQFFGTSKYMGGADTLRRVNEGEAPGLFETRRPETPNRDRVLLLNGDEAICNHSDVTNPWVAWQIARLINEYATTGASLRLVPEPTAPGCR